MANSQQFTAGIVASKTELRTLKDAFLSTQTPTERYSQAIEHLTALAQKFPDKAQGINRAIHQMREEMAGGGGFTEGAHGANELSTSLERVNQRMERMTLSEMMSTLRAIPGATIAVDIAFGNWIGAAVGAFSLAHEIMDETIEATNKTADAYQSATDKMLHFYEEEKRAREKGHAKDRLTDSGLSGEAEKAAQEAGRVGHFGFAPSGGIVGKGQSAMMWLAEHGDPLGIFTGGLKAGDFKEAFTEQGKKIGLRERDIQENDEKAEKAREAAKKTREINERAAEEIGKGMDAVNIEIANKAVELRERNMKAAEEIGKGMDAVNVEIERRGEKLAESLKTPAEKLQDNLAEILDLSRLGAISDETKAKALEDLQAKAAALADTDGKFKGITKAVSSASAEGIAARYGMQKDDKQVRVLEKANKQRDDANRLLQQIKDNLPVMGVVP